MRDLQKKRNLKLKVSIENYMDGDSREIELILMMDSKQEILADYLMSQVSGARALLNL